ncbi:MAG: KH domain-containing protein [Desulfurococcales archaeon]|jgi:ribosomal RNA assembly protein|nr:KH domain-containing protein [Desulfurococcales archaeon]
MSSEKGGVLPGITRVTTKIPLDRVGVIIGGGGSIIEMLRRRLDVSIKVDSSTGAVVVEPASPSTPVSNLLKAKEFVDAIGYGFSPDRAERVLDEDQVLVIIDLKSYVGDSENHLKRVKGRIIGEGGRARRNLEEITNTYISVGEAEVAIIGGFEEAEVARQAIQMLIEGRQHTTVYKYAERMMAGIRRRKPGLW